MVDRYYIKNNERSQQNCCLIWWKPNSHGYTANLDEAGTYTQQEIQSMGIDPGEDTPYHVDVVDKASERHVTDTSLVAILRLKYLRKGAGHGR